MKTETIHFTGNRISAFGEEIDASCIVRNRQNRERDRCQVLWELNGHVCKDPEHNQKARAYDCRPFPPGLWLVTNVLELPPDSVYYPYLIKTNAKQLLPYYHTDDAGCYVAPDGQFFWGEGYAIHFARYRAGDVLRPSRTTFGCLNTITEDNARWLGKQVHNWMAARGRIMVDIPQWNEWEAS